MREKLEHMRAHPPADPARAYGHASIAWPRELLFDARGRLAGYTMPWIQDGAPILEVFNPRRRALQMQGWDRRYLLRTARNLASALSALHEADYVVGDLSERNVLVTPRTLVTLIDTDSFQVQRQSEGQIVVYPCPVGRAEYTPPELQGRAFRGLLRRPEHDCFGLGVLIFQLLVEGNHPFRGRWLGSGEPPSLEAKIAAGRFPWAEEPGADLRPPPGAPSLEMLGPELAELCLACFVDGHDSPALRPSAATWADALEAAEDAMRSCRRGHAFAGHLRRCPDCGGRPRAGDLSEAAAPLTRSLGTAASTALGLGLGSAAGLLALPRRLGRRAGSAASPAAPTGATSTRPAIAEARPAGAAERLGRALSTSLLGLLVAGAVAGLAVLLQSGLWRLLLDPVLAAGATPAGLWALVAGGLAMAAGSLLGELEGEPRGLSDPERSAPALWSGMWSALGWLAGWMLPAMTVALVLELPWPRAAFGAVHTAAGPLELAWTVGWVLYGGLSGLLLHRQAAAPASRGLEAGVAAATGWLALQLFGLLLAAS